VPELAVVRLLEQDVVRVKAMVLATQQDSLTDSLIQVANQGTREAERKMNSTIR
jgi:hypothetical protein